MPALQPSSVTEARLVVLSTGQTTATSGALVGALTGSIVSGDGTYQFGGPSITVVDNGDDTFALDGIGVVDNGDTVDLQDQGLFQNGTTATSGPAGGGTVATSGPLVEVLVGSSVDNGDGTFTVSGPGTTLPGDGTFILTGPIGVDNGDGTFSVGSWGLLHSGTTATAI